MLCPKRSPLAVPPRVTDGVLEIPAVEPYQMCTSPAAPFAAGSETTMSEIPSQLRSTLLNACFAYSLSLLPVVSSVGAGSRRPSSCPVRSRTMRSELLPVEKENCSVPVVASG